MTVWIGTLLGSSGCLLGVAVLLVSTCDGWTLSGLVALQIQSCIEWPAGLGQTADSGLWLGIGWSVGLWD